MEQKTFPDNKPKKSFKEWISGSKSKALDKARPWSGEGKMNHELNQMKKKIKRDNKFK